MLELKNLLSSLAPETLERTQAILGRLRDQIEKGIPIIGGGAGTGISAKFEEAGGIDLIVIYNSGRFRMAGRGSLAGLLPFADANAVVLEMANEVLPVSFLFHSHNTQETCILFPVASVSYSCIFFLRPVFICQI